MNNKYLLLLKAWLRSLWLGTVDLAGKFPFPDILRTPLKQSKSGTPNPLFSQTVLSPA
jgi:hypothetical protein